MQTIDVIKNELNFIRERELEFTCKSSELKTVLVDFLSQRSKYIRSTIACLLFKALGTELSQEQLYVLVATELIHNASLIHDDAIDNSKKRRNHLSVNSKFNNKLAIIAGDFLLSLANLYILKTKSFKVITNFSDCISKMCIGESSQYFERYKIPTMQSYIEKTQNKTAELFAAAICSVSELSGTNISVDVKNFAINYGIAFQIRNDLEDYVLKNDSSDIKDGIYTAPVILVHSIDYNEIAIEKTLSLIHNYCENVKYYMKDISDNIFKTALMRIIEELCLKNL